MARRHLITGALVTAGVLWSASFVLSVVRGSAVNRTPGWVSAAVADDEYPTLLGIWRELDAESTGLKIGDRMVEIGSSSLAGVGNTEFQYIALREAQRASQNPRVVIQRDGVRQEFVTPLKSESIFWPFLIASPILFLVAIVLILRGPPTLGVRFLSASLLAGALQVSSFYAGTPALTIASWCVLLGAGLVWTPLTILAFLHLPDEARPASRWHLVWPWLFAVRGPLTMSSTTGIPVGVEFALGWIGPTTLALIAVIMVIFTRNYRRSSLAGRRQLRWVAFGVYAAAIPALIAWVALALNVQMPTVYFSALVAASMAIFPVTVMAAILFDDFLDIDRLIGAAATLNLLAAVSAVVGFVLLPRAGAALGQRLGVGEAPGQALVAVGAALAIAPAWRRLRPRIDKVLFAERHMVERGMGELVSSLAQAENPQALLTQVAVDLEELFRPRVLAIYLRDGDDFRMLAARGAAIPPALSCRSPISDLLDGGPVRAQTWLAQNGDLLEASDRAAFDALEAHVLVPVARDREGQALIAMGEKQSGDVYTPTDLTLLSAVGANLATELDRFGREQVLEEARTMHTALKRYVPGAIAAQIEQGAELEAGERDVTVLFVDIRGYTQFSEGRGASEIFSAVNEYTGMVSDQVSKVGGAVVEFNGDGMMAVFGAPAALEYKEQAAIICAIAIVGEMPSLDLEPGVTLEVGVGVATGPAFVGNIRAVDRDIWSAIGNTTNLAARLQSLTRELSASVVVDAETWIKGRHQHLPFSRHGEVQVRGRSEPRELWSLPLAPEMRSS